LAPFILAFVLGPRVEQAFRESLLLDTSIGVFFSSPLSSALVIAALLVLVLSPIGRNRLAGAEALSDVEPISDVE
jgi:TctA family transporter